MSEYISIAKLTQRKASKGTFEHRQFSLKGIAALGTNSSRKQRFWEVCRFIEWDEV